MEGQAASEAGRHAGKQIRLVHKQSQVLTRSEKAISPMHFVPGVIPQDHRLSS